MSSYSDIYKTAGVDVTAGYEGVKLIGAHAARTVREAGFKRGFGALGGLGGFGGLFAPDLSGVKKPVLVSGADGVGTKLKIAFALDKHGSIGIDCVAMCVNDIICAGAKPLFFLDYIALSKNIPEKAAEIVSGVAEGCVKAGCALIGGETAEMPGLYGENEYDLAGFAVGIVDEEKILDSANVKSGDVVIALPSSGVHSNGFSLVRKILVDSGVDYGKHFDELGGTIGEELLRPTKIYVKAMLALFDKIKVKSLAHITGGGFYENIPRALPAGLCVKIDKPALKTQAVFRILQKLGNIPERDMFNVFNMGVGMCVIVSQEDSASALNVLRENGEEAYVIGETGAGDGETVII
jgi:phosphoribosylformylglycinamidine cyclo-ligase